LESCGTYLPFFVFVAVTATSPFCEPLCVQTLRFYQIDVEQADAALIVMPNGSRTEGWFEYGTTNPPRSSTRSQSLGRGTSAQSYTHDLSGLRPDTTYFFRAVGKGGGNTTERGSVRSFTTRLTESAPNIEGLWQGQATMQTCENSIQVARFDEFCTQIGQDSFVELSLVLVFP